MSINSSKENISDHPSNQHEQSRGTASDAVLLDKLKLGFGYKSDLEIAGFLDVSSNTISKIRTGKQKLSVIQRLKVMDRLLTVQIRDLLISMSPEAIGNEIHRLSLRGAERLAFDEQGEGSSNPNDIALIDQFKRYSGFKNDEALANFLGISDSMITAARKGSQLGPLPRLRMLKAINPNADTDQIEQGLESTEYLLELINKHIEMKKSKTVNPDEKN
jgi:transcriptional regulator with XRE-family HTH domain